MYNAETIYRSYEENFRENIEGFRNLMKKEGGMELTMPELWFAVNEFYDDQDYYIFRSLHGIICRSYSILSWKRIYAHEGWNADFVRTYEKCRIVPIIFFPGEFGGIKMECYQVFRDRIDHALLDIKNYYEGRKETLMNKAYELPETKGWLVMLGSFENLIDWMGVKGVLTTENYEIYDLETGDGAILKDYWPKERYMSEWSDRYYCEIKRVYEEMRPRNLEILKSRELSRAWCCNGETINLWSRKYEQ